MLSSEETLCLFGRFRGACRRTPDEAPFQVRLR